MNKPKKPFEYAELLSMCYLCVGHALVVYNDPGLKDAKEGRERIEGHIRETIGMRWYDPDKKEIK